MEVEYGGETAAEPDAAAKTPGQAAIGDADREAGQGHDRQAREILAAAVLDAERQLAAVTAGRDEMQARYHQWHQNWHDLDAQHAALRERIASLATALEESAAVTEPSKKSDIESRTAGQLRALLDAAGDGE